MSTLRELQNTIGKLPLADQEALLTILERRVAEKYDRLAAEGVAADMRLFNRTAPGCIPGDSRTNQ